MLPKDNRYLHYLIRFDMQDTYRQRLEIIRVIFYDLQFVKVSI